MAIGFDTGTYNLVCCKRDAEGNFVNKREVNAFLSMPLENRFVFNMMKKAGVPLIERKDANTAYALGEAAVNMAYTMNGIELRRPMKAGCLNPQEKSAQQIMSIMIHSLLDEVQTDGETLYYSVPANAINEETDADYHAKVLEQVFKAFRDKEGRRVTAAPINEGLALVYAELADKSYTGLGVSCLVPGTKIYTDKGIVDIETVQCGDMVLTHNGRNRKVYNVIKKKYSGTMTTIRLFSHNYQFVDNHKLYVKKNGKWDWVGCETLEVGDVVGEPITKRSTNTEPLHITLTHRKTCSKILQTQTIFVTSDFCRLIGYFLGDGSINRKEGCIQFDFGSHEENFLKDIELIVKNELSLNSSRTFKSEKCTRLKIYNKGLMRWFGENAYDEYGKKMPFEISRLSDDNCMELLIGLIRSDGCSSGEQINFHNNNSRLMFVFKQLCSRLNMPCGINYRKNKRISYINDRSIQSKHNEWTASIGSYSAMSLLAERVEEINNPKEISHEKNKQWFEDGFCCTRIHEITKTNNWNGDVYDLQVEDDHSFSGPFLTISNCGAGMVNICFAIYGAPIFQFALVNSGDWIDKMAAKATGETPTFINKEKLKADLTIDMPESIVQRAIKAQYEIMMTKTITGIKNGLEEKGNKARHEHPIDIIIAGGTSQPPGFDVMFRQLIKKANLPIEIGSVIRPKDPLYSVARGALIAAEAADQG